jgi:hypothetical protein
MRFYPIIIGLAAICLHGCKDKDKDDKKTEDEDKDNKGKKGNQVPAHGANVQGVQHNAAAGQHTANSGNH